MHEPMLKVYEYAKCSTCQKALKFLDARKVDYQRVAIVDQPPTVAELKKMLGFVGDIRKLFNTSGMVYRELGLSDKLSKMSEAQALKLLASNGKLIKRPFVLGADSGSVGFSEAGLLAQLRSSKEAEWKKL